MEQPYSLKKGIGKGLLSLLAIAGAFVAFTGASDVSLIVLIQNYLFPLISGLTVGGIITIVVNFVKFRFF